MKIVDAKVIVCCPGRIFVMLTDIEKLAAQFSYQRAYLPVNRMLDGTVHSW